MTTCKFQSTSLLFSKVVGIQIKKDNQGYKEMKGHMLWLHLTSNRKHIGLKTSRKYYLRFMLPTSGLQRRRIALSEYTKI